MEMTKAVYGINMKADDSFSQLYQSHYSDILGIAIRITGNYAIGEDLTQEAFIKLYQKPPLHGNKIGWLKTVVANLCYSHIQKKNRWKKREKEMIHLFEPLEESLEDQFFDRVEAEKVQHTLNKLPPKEKTALVLRHSGFLYKEIAEILSVNVTSIGTIIARAQNKFKKFYCKEV